MREVIVSNETEADEAKIKAATDGLRLAAVSNAGLPHGKLRLTFLPAEAFTDRTDQKVGTIRRPKIT